ncbi:MAG: TetR/AcrR family transcriptional regulator [Cyclobacteriaceae bacterium]
MRNSEVTKLKILEASSRLFNVQGYKATSISDITTATGLTKGAIYRHFHDKDELEEESFNHLADIIKFKFSEQIRSKSSAPEKLMAICSFFQKYIDNPTIIGGCPLLNAAIETDDTKPGLQKEVLRLMITLQDSLVSIIRKGIKYGQIKPTVNPEFYGSVFIAALEGGIMMSKLKKDKKDINSVVEHLQHTIEGIKI